MFATLSATLQSLEKKSAILMTDDGQTLRVPKDDLWQPTPGARYTIRIMLEEDARVEQNELAITILNRLLKPDDRTKDETPDLAQ